MKSWWLLLIPLSLGIPCDAHGYVQSLAAGGKEYSGWLPFTDPYQDPIAVRIVRKIPSDGPITNTSSPSLVCNVGGRNGSPKTAEVAAGSDIQFKWTKWPDDHLGPITTYMTSCDGDCTTFDPVLARWFKIDEAGYVNGKWATTQLISQNNTWTSRIPHQIRSGEYLLRNEIMALHDASAAQMYPSCSQVKIIRGGDAEPPDYEKMTIIEAYKNFTTPNIWSDSFTSFTIPGPKVAALARDHGKNDSSQSSHSLGPVAPPTSSSGSSPMANTTSTGSQYRRQRQSPKRAPKRLLRHY